MKQYKPNKTLFSKLLTTYGITIIISFTILAVLLMNIFDRYFIGSKQELLIEQAEKISHEISMSYFVGVMDWQRLIEDVKLLDKFLDARIWLIDENGTVLMASGADRTANLNQTIDRKRLSTLYRGYYINERGNFGGRLREHSLTIGYPIFYGDSFKGGVLIHASLPELKKTLRNLYATTAIVVLLSMFFAYIGLYFHIKRISNPIKEISEAAKRIASGEFQKRLEIDTNDEIEELSRSFNHMAESLEKIEENRANLIANISHDLRTPMTSIIGFIEGILDGTIPQQSHNKYLNIALGESRRLVKITNDIMELSNMQQGVISVNKGDFDLSETIRRKLLSFEKKITEKELEVSLILENEKNIVSSDQTLIDRILLNLLDNAVKFTPLGGEILIKTYDDADKTLVEIVNMGVSINQEELKKIWDRFHKGDASRGRHRSGFGLGLAIVKEIIHLLDEEIRVDSGKDFVKFVFTITKK